MTLGQLLHTLNLIWDWLFWSFVTAVVLGACGLMRAGYRWLIRWKK